jgi:hypothetical protein
MSATWTNEVHAVQEEEAQGEVGSLGPRKDGLNVASFFFSSCDFLLLLFFSCSILKGKTREGFEKVFKQVSSLI